MSTKKSYSELLNELSSLQAELNGKDIRVGPFEETIKKLKLHTTNIEKVEKDIEAIQAEVIQPIKKELNYNRKAGRFSVLGFYLGALGIILSISSSLFNAYYNPQINSTSNLQKSEYAAEELEQTQTQLVALQDKNKKLLSKINSINQNLLLYRTISKVNSERRGSVEELLGKIDNSDTNQWNIMYFYLMHLPDMLENDNKNGVMYATLILSKLKPEILQERKKEIEEFYKNIYMETDWNTTSDYYEEVASKIQILVDYR
ncbi:conserved hypothetical protein [Candidatus Magnetomoraceae bacterium gMMP-15]